MMTLPPPPPVYETPPERWFDRYNVTADQGGLGATLNAMWAILHDRLNCQPESHRFTTVEGQLLKQLHAKYGERMMDVWREACNQPLLVIKVEDTFLQMLSGKGLE